MWQQIVQGAVGYIKGYTQAGIDNAITETNNRLDAVEVANANRVRGAGNAFAAARGALARYMQSVQNNQRLEAGGAALEESLVNARRQEDTILQGGFEQAIRSSEQLGGQAAAASFAGIGGEVADTVSIATRLSQQRASREASQGANFRSYDAARRAAAIQSQTVRGLDSSIILDAIDYNVNVAQPGYILDGSDKLYRGGATGWQAVAGGQGAIGTQNSPKRGGGGGNQSGQPARELSFSFNTDNTGKFSGIGAGGTDASYGDYPGI